MDECREQGVEAAERRRDDADRVEGDGAAKFVQMIRRVGRAMLKNRYQADPIGALTRDVGPRTSALVSLYDQVVGALSVAGRFEVHSHAQVRRSAPPQIRPRAALIEYCEVARELIALGA